MLLILENNTICKVTQSVYIQHEEWSSVIWERDGQGDGAVRREVE